MTRREIDIDAQIWIIPGARTKNGEPHEISLSDKSLEVIETIPHIGNRPDFLFSKNGRTFVSGFSRAKARLDAAMIMDADGVEIEPWRLHDLRRTVASGMARLGISLPVIEKCLNHTSGTFGGIVGVYQRHSFADEKRKAFKTWGSHIASLTGDAAPGNVVQLAGAK
jgi:integrase